MYNPFAQQQQPGMMYAMGGAPNAINPQMQTQINPQMMQHFQQYQAQLPQGPQKAPFQGFQDFRTQFQDWRGDRPQFEQGGDRQAFMGQIRDWRDDRPGFGNALAQMPQQFPPQYGMLRG